MHLLLLGLFAIGSAALAQSTQTHPDFSGTWIMDPTRSEAAAQGTPIGPVTMVIRQSPEEVRIELTRNGTKQAIRYLPAGMKPVGQGEILGTFRWEGSKLVTNASADINKQAVTFDEVRTLSADGAEMTVEITVVVQHGYQTGGSSVVKSPNAPNSSTGKNVFVKSR